MKRNKYTFYVVMNGTVVWRSEHKSYKLAAKALDEWEYYTPDEE